MRFRGRWVAKGAAFAVFGLALLAVLSFVVMALWNAIIPHLFSVPTLDFWEAAGLLILSRILFGGFRRGGWHGHGHGGWRGHMWRQHWENMSPEERERLRAKFKHRCGWAAAERPVPEQTNSTPPSGSATDRNTESSP